jgi:CHRD domain
MQRFRHLVAAGAVAVAAIAVADSGPVSAEVRAFGAVLKGANEVPGPGDDDGSGVAGVLINTDTGRICYAIAVRKIEPATLAHIHRGTATESGPVVVNFKPPTRGFVAGCTDAGAALAAEIAGNPSGFYVNVHNAKFTAGAVRGQLR